MFRELNVYKTSMADKALMISMAKTHNSIYMSQQIIKLVCSMENAPQASAFAISIELQKLLNEYQSPT